MKKTILVAGATGNLGERIIHALLLRKDATIRIIVRPGSDEKKIKTFESLGVDVYRLTAWRVEEITKACTGVSCVVSVLAGLREVVVDAQKILLDAAIQAKVPRFIPSDYSMDFTNFSDGENRNLDLRREFHHYLDASSIAATTIFNGAFTDLLTGQMPLVLFKQKLILYWGNADLTLTFTTMDDTAAYTANVALDSTTPRYLSIAGDQISPKQLREVMIKITGTKYILFRAGGTALLGIIIKIARMFSSGEKELYPAWQGMQYMRNMADKRAQLTTLDNERYAGMVWTTAADVLARHFIKTKTF